MTILSSFLRQASLVACVASALYSASSTAAISVSVEQPDWHFVIKNHLRGNKHEKISPQESEFVQSIQEDLSNGRYQNVANAFSKQNVSEFSPRLQELYGQVLLNTKRYSEAQTVLARVVKEMPHLGAAHRSLSMAYLLNDQLESARTHLVKSVELGIADAQLYGQLAYVNLQLGRAVSAVSAYQSALMLEPESKQWHQGLLFALIETGAYAQATSLLDEMLISEPNDAKLWLQRGQIALQQGQNQKAIGSLETAMSLEKPSLSNLVSLAKLHVTDGSARRATDIVTSNISSFTKAKDKQGWQTIQSIGDYLASREDWRNLGKLVSATKKSAGSLDHQKRAHLYVFEAKLAVANKQQSKAIDLLQKAVAAVPNDGEALLSLAQLYRDTNKAERAKMYYLRAQALKEYKQRAMLGQAQIAINQRQYQDALTLLRDVYKAYPARSDLLGNIQSLENLVRNTI